MRNLKRALSLALASIMLLGMMVTGAGAASTSFTDFDQIVNQEAAEVTTGIGIFDGYTNGSFGPENVVTRAEMAVIICKLLNGSDVDPGNFTGISKFTDVPAWAEGYVNFCAASGIVVGVGEGKFNPSATVTTVEAATMLLKALGYFVEEDQLGADWKTVVTGRATSQGLYGSLVLKADEGLTRDNVAELLFHTLFAQRVAYDDNRHLYVKNTNRDVVVTNGTEDRENTFAMNTFGMWYIDGVVTANSCTEDSLSEAVYNAPRTNVVFDRPADYMGPANTTEYPFEYTTGLDMIAHAARVYYSMKNNAPVVYAIADRAEKVAYITYDKNNTRLADAATAAGFRKNSILNIATKDYKVNYSWDRTVGVLDTDATKQVNLTGPEIAKTLIVISNSSDCKVDYVIVLDQYLDTVKRVIERNGKTEYDLTTVDADRQTIVYDSLAEGDYVIVTDVGKEGDTFNLTKPEQVSASISKITGVSDQRGTVKSITADGTEYKGSPVFDHKDGSRALDNVTNFEDITTLGETTLLLDDTLGLCIGLAQPEAPELYAYVAQFAEKHVDGFGTEFKLVAKAYLSDGTEGTYLVNTSAGNSATNSFKGYEFASRGGDELDLLNGVKNINGKVLGYGANDANGIGHNLAVYNDNSFSMVGADDHANGVGLGVYAATLRADGSIVLAKLTTSDSAERANESEARVVTGHSTLIAQKDLAGTNIKKGDNVTFADDAVTRDRNTLYQTSKTVVFYVNGHWNDTNGKNTLTVTAKTGIDNMKGFTVQHDTNDVTGFKQGDDNAWAEHFLQIGSKVDSSRREVTAELIHGLKVEDDANLYFYKQGNYEVDWVNGSKAGEQKATITFNVYDSKGELKKVTYDNNGRYFEESEINGEVKDIPTGWYTIGSQKLETVVRYDNDVKGNGVKIVGNDTHVKDDRIENDNKAKDKIFVLNAIVDHVDYENNIFTELENVGGITKDAVIVDLTGENLFDSASDIDRACKAHHVVKISYFYTISGSDSYKVKAVFVTGYDPDELDRPSEKNVNVYSEVVGGRLRTFNNWQASYVAIANEAERAFKAAGYTVTNVNPTAFYGQAENGAPRYFWAMTVAKENTTQNVTNMPYTANGNVGMMGWYVDIEDAMNKVCVNGSWRSWILSGTSTEVSVTPGTKTVPVEVTTYLTETNSVFGETVTKSIDVVSNKAVYTDSYSQFSKTINFVTNGQTGSNVVNVTDITAELKSGAEKLAVGENLDESLKVGYEYIFTSELTDEDVLYTVAWTEKESGNTVTVAEAGKTYVAVVTLTVADGKDYVLTGTTTKSFEFTAEEAGEAGVLSYNTEKWTASLTKDGQEVDKITDTNEYQIVLTAKEALDAENPYYGVLVDGVRVIPTVDKKNNTLTFTYTPGTVPTAAVKVTVQHFTSGVLNIKGPCYVDLGNGLEIICRIAPEIDESRAVVDAGTSGLDVTGTLVKVQFGDNLSITFMSVDGGRKLVIVGAPEGEMDNDACYEATEADTVPGAAVNATATPAEGSDKIENVTFELGQPLVEGALLPTHLVIDENVEAEITWYDPDGNALEEGAVATATEGYTYTATVKAVEGKENNFAETVTVTIGDNAPVEADIIAGVIVKDNEISQAETVSVSGFDVRAKKTDAKVELNAVLDRALAETLLNITKGTVTPAEADSAVETDITWSVKDAEEGAAAPETADNADAIYVATVKLKIAAANTADYILDKEYSKSVEFAVDATPKTPIESIDVNVTGTLDAATVPTFEAVATDDIVVSKAVRDLPGTVLSDTTYTWTIKITARDGDVKLVETTEINLICEDKTIEDRITKRVDVENSAICLSVTTDKAPAENTDTLQLSIGGDDGKTIIFYAYYGPDGKDEITTVLDNIAIARRLSAMGEDYVTQASSIVADESTAGKWNVTTDKGVKLSFMDDKDNTGGRDGGRDDPKPMYLITKPDKTTAYAWPTGVITGLKDVAAIIPMGTNVSKATGGAAIVADPGTFDGKQADLPDDLDKDTVYVEALPLKAGDTANGELKADDSATTKVALVKVKETDDATTKTNLDTTASSGLAYIAKGATVYIEPVTEAVNALKGQNITFKVNGEEVATGKYGADGKLTLNGEYAGKTEIPVVIDKVDMTGETPAKAVTFAAEVGYTVTLDGKKLTSKEDDATKFDIAALPSGTELARVETDENGKVSYVALTEDAYDDTTKVYTFKDTDTDENSDGGVHLVTAFKVANIGSEENLNMYTKFVGTESAENDEVAYASSDSNYTYSFVPVSVGETPATLWVEAANANVELVVADKNVATMVECVVNPTMWNKGVWKVTISGTIVNTSFGAGLTLPDDETGETGVTSEATSLNKGGTADFVVEGINDENAKVVSVTWEQPVPGVTLKGVLTEEGLKITATNSGDTEFEAGGTVGVVRIRLTSGTDETLEMDSLVTLKLGTQ